MSRPTFSQVEVAADAPALAVLAARRLAAALALAGGRGDEVRVALAGGRTPRPIYEALAREPLRFQVAWSSLSIAFTDERCVPPDDPRSNFKMAREALAAAPLVDEQFLRMPGERADREAAAAEHAAAFPEVLDVLVLGMGADGHVASLFPGSPALAETAQRVVAAPAPETAGGGWRLTITPPVVGAARAVFVLAAGTEKAKAVHAALREDGPVAAVPARLARRATWLLDAAAAALLPPA